MDNYQYFPEVDARFRPKWLSFRPGTEWRRWPKFNFQHPLNGLYVDPGTAWSMPNHRDPDDLARTPWSPGGVGRGDHRRFMNDSQSRLPFRGKWLNR